MINTFTKFILNKLPRPVLIRISYLVRFITSIVYRGKKYHCPVCKGNFRKLLPYGYENVRKDALCPKCFSLERHRLMWLFLNEKTNFFTAQLKVLHIAPEQCFKERFKKMTNLTYHTGDLESPLADFKFDVQQMPFDANTYDVVICNHVLEHVADFQIAAREILRVLKQTGWAILLIPADFKRDKTFEDNTITDPAERRKIFGQYDHVRVFGTDYPKLLTDIGFKVNEPNYYDELDDSIKAKYALNLKEFMYAFEK